MSEERGYCYDQFYKVNKCDLYEAGFELEYEDDIGDYYIFPNSGDKVYVLFLNHDDLENAYFTSLTEEQLEELKEYDIHWGLVDVDHSDDCEDDIDFSMSSEEEF